MKKRIKLLFLSLDLTILNFFLWSMVICNYSAFGQNLLRNPGFEDSKGYEAASKIPEWPLWKSRGDIKVFIRNDWVSEGKNALEIQLGPNSRGALYQDFPFRGGVNVQIEIKFRFKNAPAGNDKFYWSIYCLRGDDVFYTISEPFLEEVKSGTPEWWVSKKEFYIPADTTKIRFFLSFSRAEGSLYIDDMSFSQGKKTEMASADEWKLLAGDPPQFNPELANSLQLAVFAGGTNRQLLKSFGITVVHDYGQYNTPESIKDLTAALDEDHLFGLKRLFYPYHASVGSASYEQKIAGIKKLIPLVKDHPGVFGYYLNDEPLEHGVSIGELERINRLIKSIDSVHPTVIVDNTPQGFNSYHRVCDIIIPDCYPAWGVEGVPNPVAERRAGLSWPLEFNLGFRKLTGSYKPFWITPQGFSYAWMFERDMWKTRGPTLDEFRGNVYIALASGASGVLTYAFTYAFIEPGTRFGFKQTYRELQVLREYFPYGKRNEFDFGNGENKKTDELKLHIADSFDRNNSPVIGRTQTGDDSWIENGDNTDNNLITLNGSRLEMHYFKSKPNVPALSCVLENFNEQNFIAAVTIHPYPNYGGASGILYHCTDAGAVYANKEGSLGRAKGYSVKLNIKDIPPKLTLAYNTGILAEKPIIPAQSYKLVVSVFESQHTIYINGEKIISISDESSRTDDGGCLGLFAFYDLPRFDDFAVYKISSRKEGEKVLGIICPPPVIPVYVNGWDTPKGPIVIGVNYGKTAENFTFTIRDKNFPEKLFVFPEKRTLQGVRSGEAVTFSDRFEYAASHVYLTKETAVPPELLLPDVRKQYNDFNALIAKNNADNAAWIGNGARSSASSSRRFASILAIDGVTNLTPDGVPAENYWQDSTENVFPDWLQVDFAREETTDRAMVVSFNLRDFEIQMPQGNTWKTVATVKDNTNQVRNVSFEPVHTQKIRLNVTAINAGHWKDGHAAVIEFSVYRKK